MFRLPIIAIALTLCCISSPAAARPPRSTAKARATAKPRAWSRTMLQLVRLQANRRLRRDLRARGAQRPLARRVFSRRGRDGAQRLYKQTLVLDGDGLQLITEVPPRKGGGQGRRLVSSARALVGSSKKVPLRPEDWWHMRLDRQGWPTRAGMPKRGGARPLQPLVGKPDTAYYHARVADFRARNPGESVPRYYRFVIKNAERFVRQTRGKLSPEGRRWIERVYSALQQHLEDARRTDPVGFAQLERSGKLSTLGYFSHVPSYLRTGFAKLPASDLLQIARTPDLQDFANVAAVGSTGEVAAAWLRRQLSGR